MNIIVIISELSVVLLFFALGILFSTGKGSMLIAGFNTMKAEEKEKYDKKKLCKFMGKTMFALGFCVALWMLSDILEIIWILCTGLGLFFAIIIFILIYANTAGRFKVK